MSETNFPAEKTTHTVAGDIDTNAEYILPAEANKQPPVLLSVSKFIVIETIKDFFVSVIGFFLRYIKHFVRCLVYFFSPSLKKKPFNNLDFKENSQHAFEFVIIVLAVLIFMIKVEWIPQSSKDLVELYNNDLLEKFFEVFLFFLFAVYYIVFSGLSILSGRLFRFLFRVNMTRRESDILFVYLNNAFFSISAIVALVIRSSASLETHDQDSVYQVLAMIIMPTVILPILVWSIRFAALHQMKLLKGILFFLFSVVFFTVFYCLTSIIVSMTIIGA